MSYLNFNFEWDYRFRDPVPKMRPSRAVVLLLFCFKTGVAISKKDNLKRMSSGSNEPSELGGGAINEKKRTFQNHESAIPSGGFDPVHCPAHLYHALEGLHRYPQYLSRWSSQPDAMDRLEEALELQLQKVRDQKQRLLEHRQEIQEIVENDKISDGHSRLQSPPQTWDEIQALMDPAAWRAIEKSKQFRSPNRPTVQQVLTGEVPVELDVAQLQIILDEECFDVYSWRILNPEFCRSVRAYVQDATNRIASSSSDAPNNKSRRPIDLDFIGLGWLTDLLFHLVLQPVTRHLFRTTERLGQDLDWRQGYVAGYSGIPSDVKGTPLQYLVAHTDDSEVTLNLGLTEGNEDFVGGDLEFRGLRGDGRDDLEGTVRPRLGTALIHAGRHLHAVTPVTEGDRYALIVWARSWQGIRRQTCPCCWLNRRRPAGDCICDKAWN